MDFRGGCGSAEVQFTFIFRRKLKTRKSATTLSICHFFCGREGKISLENRVTHSSRDDFGLKGNYKEKNLQNQKCLFETEKCI